MVINSLQCNPRRDEKPVFLFNKNCGNNQLGDCNQQRFTIYRKQSLPISSEKTDEGTKSPTQ